MCEQEFLSLSVPVLRGSLSPTTPRTEIAKEPQRLIAHDRVGTLDAMPTVVSPA
jgi:hypothetical protein